MVVICSIFFELSQIYSFALDTVAAISEKQKMLQKQRQEIEEIERNSDREVSFDQKRWRLIFAPEMLQTNKGRGLERVCYSR